MLTVESRNQSKMIQLIVWERDMSGWCMWKLGGLTSNTSEVAASAKHYHHHCSVHLTLLLFLSI